MCTSIRALLACNVAMLVQALGAIAAPTTAPPRHTVAAIEKRAFHVNGKPTYADRTYNGVKIEGLLLNSRMVQAIFGDRNPETRKLWNYPNGPWDAERNTREFIAAMPDWRKHGLLSFTI